MAGPARESERTLRHRLIGPGLLLIGVAFPAGMAAAPLPAATQCQTEPVVLFVPGFTGGMFGPDSADLKREYFRTQKDDLMGRGRTVIDMNDRPGFDSDRTAVVCNADDVAEALRSQQDADRQVTIVSHSKGGQEVLEALIRNEDVWPTVRGWLALTTNFFEAEFTIEGGAGEGQCDMVGGGPTPPFCGAKTRHCRDKDFPEQSRCPNGDSAGSRYGGFPRGEDIPFLQGPGRRDERRRARVDYMRENQDGILRLLASVPTLSLWASYIPALVRDPVTRLQKENGHLNLFNRGLRREATVDGPAAPANDGLVPTRAGVLPRRVSSDGRPSKLRIRKLPDDPVTAVCGVDHLAPAALNRAFSERRSFWSEAFRDTTTWAYIQEVEARCGAAPPASLNHFLCYDVRRAPFARVAGVGLVDDFGASVVGVRRPTTLCAPASKNDEDPAAPEDPDHLVGYEIRRDPPRFGGVRDEVVEDQLGTLVLDLRRPVRLLLPTAKGLTDPATPLASAAIDHYQCYDVRGGRRRVPNVALADQFGIGMGDVKRPSRLCVPVDKNGEGILDPAARLTCYRITRGPRVNREVFIDNQLGAGSLEPRRARELCVPGV